MNRWILRLIGLVVTVASPAIRKDLETYLNQLEASAKKTENPWDDIFVDMLKTLMLGQ